MKKVGLIGGATWHSTIAYLEQLHWRLRAQAPRGGSLSKDRSAPSSESFQSCDLLIRNLDFSKVVMMQRRGQFDELSAWLKKEALELEAAGCEAIAITSNTLSLHEGTLKECLKIPLISIFEACVAEARVRNFKRMIVVGTKYTMSQTPFFPYLSDGSVEIFSPCQADQKWINQAILSEFVWGTVSEATVKRFSDLRERVALDGFDAILYGCTEIGLFLSAHTRTGTAEADPFVLDSLPVHVAAISAFQLSL